ncbi:hypothetical protein [Kitasatospora sp. NPDC127116]|uniref:hypothetical protein n=1 Tax=Kitasatospora sp. NPDC127116 TaxID=3345367 RepID=UPI00362D2C8A
MSVATYVEIRCDGPKECGAATHLPYSSTAAEVRTIHREAGWHQRPGGRDICPTCWTAAHR